MRMARELHLELLLGKRVHDADGKPVGRIEEFRAEQQGGEWVLREYLVGSYGLWERLAAWSILRAPFGGKGRGRGYKIRWDQLDTTDPDHPHTRCRRDELAQGAE